MTSKRTYGDAYVDEMVRKCSTLTKCFQILLLTRHLLAVALVLPLTQVRRDRIKEVALRDPTLLEKAARQYQTAFMLAQSTSTAQLYVNGIKIDWLRLSNPSPSALSPTRAARDVISKLFKAQPEIQSELPRALRAYCIANDSPIPVSICIVRSGVLSSKVEWERDADYMQTVHASPDIWKQPWFDSISVKGKERHDGVEVDVKWYGQLRALFRTPDGQQLALIRWYQRVPMPRAVAERGILQKLGCVRLKWETTGTAQRPRYDVIDFKDILSRVYIVPDFLAANFFHVSPWKWDRGEACKSGFLVRRSGHLVGSDSESSDEDVE